MTGNGTPTTQIQEYVESQCDEILELQGRLWDIEEHNESCNSKEDYYPGSEGALLAEVARLKNINELLKADVPETIHVQDRTFFASWFRQRPLSTLQQKMSSENRASTRLEQRVAEQATAIERIKHKIESIEQETENCESLQSEVDQQQSTEIQSLFMSLKSASADQEENNEHLRARAKEDVEGRRLRNKVFYAGVLAIFCGPVSKWTRRLGLPDLCW